MWCVTSNSVFPLRICARTKIQIMKRRRQIESAGGFIQHQHSRVVHQRTAQQTTPLFAGRHLRKFPVGQETDAKFFHHDMGASNLSRSKILMPIGPNTRIVP